MFATSDDNFAASEAASQQLKLWEKNLGFRIHLQKAVDLSNKIPIFPIEGKQPRYGNVEVIAANNAASSKCLETMITDIIGILDDQATCEIRQSEAVRLKAARKRLRNSDDESSALLWEKVKDTQASLSPKWKEILEKWHARLNFGSEYRKSQLKVFNQSIWETVRRTTKSKLDLKLH